MRWKTTHWRRTLTPHSLLAPQCCRSHHSGHLDWEGDPCGEVCGWCVGGVIVCVCVCVHAHVSMFVCVCVGRKNTVQL